MKLTQHCKALSSPIFKKEEKANICLLGCGIFNLHCGMWGL